MFVDCLCTIVVNLNDYLKTSQPLYKFSRRLDTYFQQMKWPNALILQSTVKIVFRFIGCFSKLFKVWIIQSVFDILVNMLMQSFNVQPWTRYAFHPFYTHWCANSVIGISTDQVCHKASSSRTSTFMSHVWFVSRGVNTLRCSVWSQENIYVCIYIYI